MSWNEVPRTKIRYISRARNSIQFYLCRTVFRGKTCEVSSGFSLTCTNVVTTVGWSQRSAESPGRNFRIAPKRSSSPTARAARHPRGSNRRSKAAANCWAAWTRPNSLGRLVVITGDVNRNGDVVNSPVIFEDEWRMTSANQPFFRSNIKSEPDHFRYLTYLYWLVVSTCFNPASSTHRKNRFRCIETIHPGDQLRENHHWMLVSTARKKLRIIPGTCRARYWTSLNMLKSSSWRDPSSTGQFHGFRNFLTYDVAWCSFPTVKIAAFQRAC